MSVLWGLAALLVTVVVLDLKERLDLKELKAELAAPVRKALMVRRAHKVLKDQ